MAVQLHYNGSVFDLDSNRGDAFWVKYIDDTVQAVNDGGVPLPLGINLNDGRGANLWLFPGTPIGIVAAPELLFPADA
ncbi:hypothetical protein H490_0104060 [Leucobacter sp. UCD-THU]|uniref:hypothetical protein n=1 Tax=Leucobacter sp. UCD-THU TaxID=1292023 RepID=UPI000369587D|nr:hypothetical protein [Leucobacter sp. UCD-THU]EYT56047.1 hypothetical protein H490_0104060 [Leucobacter sp. UCD-THU]